MIHFSAWILNNPYTLGALCILLTFGPIIGIWYIHQQSNVKRRRTEGVAQTTQREDQATEDRQIV